MKLAAHSRRLAALLALSTLLALPALGLAADKKINLAELKRATVSHHADIVHATYEDALSGARVLQTAVEAFLAKPSATSLATAKQAWLAARVPYVQTETCRFYEGPIEEVEMFINAWPIDENYVDYVKENPKAGVINKPDSYPKITKELIESLNEREGEKNISAGYHVIEFLLWGQDFDASGPGQRPYTDYTPAAKNHERRAAYLRIATQLLIEKLEIVVTAWEPNHLNNYRAQFVSKDPDIALANVLKGMGSLAGPELSGERMTVAYETKEQEDEHSCFSDNTHIDIVYNAIGIQNVYLGRYVRVGGLQMTGPGIHDVLAAVNPTAATALKAQMENSVAALRHVPIPFDQAFVGGRRAPNRLKMKAAIQSLQAQSDQIAKAATTLGLQLNL